MTDTLLDIQGLTVRFDGASTAPPAVDDVGFSIARGEVVALVGESGSGKSVTAKSVMQLIGFAGGRITAGTARLRDRNGGELDLFSLNESRMQALRGNRVAMIFQEPMTSLNPVLSIGYQLAEPVMRHRGLSQRAAQKVVLEALEQVRIPEPARRLMQYPHELSGGMRQRVMIAMALLCKPDLLIADEPTTALDVTVQAEILALLKLVQAETGMAMLFITHDMGVVAEIADQVVVMLRGKVVENGTVHQVFSNPRHEYTQRLLAAAPRLGAAPERVAVVPPPPADQAAQTMPPVTPVLSVRNLVTRFPIRHGILQRVTARVHAVEDVSFDLMPGETLALVGESGCGKSTTGKAIMRLIGTDSGDILLEGRDVNAMNHQAMQEARRGIQMVFQDPFASLNPRMAVERIVAEPLLIHRMGTPAEIRARVAELLLRVGLTPEQAKRYPHQFSGGQRQRICIARALALNPKVIIADEAVSALDVSIQGQILALLDEIQREFGIAILFISHDMAVVERVSDRVAVMYLGEIIEIGRARDVLAKPAHPYTRRLLDAVPISHPDQRRVRPPSLREIRSPIRPADYVHQPQPMVSVGEQHYVRAH